MSIFNFNYKNMSKEKNKNYIFALTKENIDNIVNHPLTIICLILIVLYITLPLNYRIASHISNDIIEGNMSKQYISQIESIDNKNDFLEFINV
jgi:Fe2+ transport system protein B